MSFLILILVILCLLNSLTRLVIVLSFLFVVFLLRFEYYGQNQHFLLNKQGENFEPL